MNLIYFDINCKGGAPEDVRDFIKHSDEMEHDVIDTYTEFLKNLRNKKRVPYILFGGLIVRNIIFFIILKHCCNREVYLWNFSHLCAWNRTNKLFTTLPIIKSGSLVEKPRKSKMIFLRTVFKKIFIYLARLLYKKSDGFIVASDWEASELKKFFSLPELKYKKFNFGTRKLAPFTKIKEKRIVYWGRVDFKNKGLDRLIDFVLKSSAVLREEALVVELIGPDYNNGKALLSEELRGTDIEDLIRIVPDSDVGQFDQSYFTNSEFSILLSRFEGHSRTCREASHAGMKQFISSETHMDGRQNCFLVDDELNLQSLREFIFKKVHATDDMSWTKVCLLDQSWHTI